MTSRRLLALGVTAAIAGILTGVGGATIGVSGARPATQPRTLVEIPHRIWAFALSERRITWIGQARLPGPRSNCGMYVETLRTGRISVVPLPRTGCGAKSHRYFAPQAPVLASGVAAWTTGYSCGNNECFWAVATITAGEKRARTIEKIDVACDFVCDGGSAPVPALAGAGNVLVFSAGGGGGPSPSSNRVKRVVGRRTLVITGGNIEKLVVRGGVIEAVSRALVKGDGCGCLDSPAWSPDGSKIAYFRGTFWNQQANPYPPDAALALMNADGSGRHDLTTSATVSAGPTWSPDGKQIAYTAMSRTSPFPETIVVANADGSGSRELGPGYDPAWSPDGSKIAFVSAGCGGSVAAISTMKPDGTNVQQLASFPPGPCLGEGGIAWSPDGTRIAFPLNGMLEVMNADGSNTHPLGNGIVGDEPAWSPDSSRIVFHEQSGLWEIGADGTGLHQLTTGPDEHPSWSPDGATIVFGSDRNDPYVNSGELSSNAFPELYVVDPAGNGLRPLSFTTPSAFEQQTTFYTASGKTLPSLPGLPALAGRVAAVGSTSAAGSHQIVLFDRATGAQLAQVQVAAGHGRFAVAGADSHWIVFRIGRKISALDAQSHRIIRLAEAAAEPLDLSVAGRRVAWAENIRGHGRIRALELPS